MCYVGKATKIFICVVAVMVVVGLVLGLGVFRHGLQRAHKCEGGDCAATGAGPRPVFSDPIPATTTAAPSYLLSPPTTTSAAPPPLLSPPTTAAAQGPVRS